MEGNCFLSLGVGGLGKEGENTDCAGPIEDGGMSSDLAPWVVMLMKALCTKSHVLNMRQNWAGSLHLTCYMGS